MALDKEPAAEAATEEKNDAGAAVDQQFAEADAKADPVEPPSLEELAGRIGWVPQDKFKGPSEKWKPADQFILDGHEIQTRTSRQLKDVNDRLETISKTTGAIMAERLTAQKNDLARQYAAAVEKGDPGEAFKIGEKIHSLDAQAQPATPQPAAETEAWVQKNAKVKGDPVAWQRALQINDAYARAYPQSSVVDQLAYTEQNLKREFPHLFDDKAPPSVNGNISRNAGGGVSKSGTTYADLPKEAKAQADDLAERGLATKEKYAEHYFAAKAKKE